MPLNSKYIGVHLIVIIFSLFLLFGMVVTKISTGNDYKKHINAEFIQVDATIVEYKELEYDEKPYYATYFEYECSNGKIYKGFWSNDINSEEQARSMIGTKVKVYFNNEFFGTYRSEKELKEVYDRESKQKDRNNSGINTIVVCSLLFLNSAIRTGIFFANRRRQQIV